MTDSDVVELLVRMDERTKQTAEDVDQLKHVILEGNGSPPLTVAVARTEERLTALEATGKERVGMSVARLGVLATVGGAGITGVFKLIELLLG